MKTVLITGASSGFGKGTASKLLEIGGWNVYATARRVDQMRDLEDQGATVRQLDVIDEDATRALVEEIVVAQGRIDALLANAGYGSYGMVEAVPLEEIQHQFDVNVFGVARSIQAVLPHMRAQRSGRIVITESIVSHMSTLGLGWYAATKHALRGMSIALRQEVRDLGIEVVAIEPGTVVTGFADVALRALAEVDHPDDYQELAQGFNAYMVDSYSRAPGPESTVKAMVEALTADDPKPVYKTTTDAKIGPKVLGMVPDKAADHMVLKAIRRASKEGAADDA